MACTVLGDTLPYLHILRWHIGHHMVFFAKFFNFGYGYLSTNAGEHLNKIIKKKELAGTNLDEKRFQKIITDISVKQFHFTTSIMQDKSDKKCSACNGIGHNKKNRSCPLHPSHPKMTFDESDDEDQS